MKELTIKAAIENIEKVTIFVNTELEALDCPYKAEMQIDLAIDELFGNIANYASRSILSRRRSPTRLSRRRKDKSAGSVFSL